MSGIIPPLIKSTTIMMASWAQYFAKMENVGIRSEVNELIAVAVAAKLMGKTSIEIRLNITVKYKKRVNWNEGSMLTTYTR